MSHQDALRDMAQHARKTAELIHQPDHPEYVEFQNAVPVMPIQRPDVDLRAIERQLRELTTAIESYLASSPAG
jgi:hypothetical protein